MIATAIVALRVVLLLLAAWCLKRTGSSLLALWRGSQSLAEVGRAVQAFFALACVVGQIFYLIWSQPPVLMLALTCSSIGLGLAVWTSKRAEAKGLKLLDAMIDRPDLMLPMIELSEDQTDNVWTALLPMIELAALSEIQAQELARQARQMIADRRLDL